MQQAYILYMIYRCVYVYTYINTDFSVTIKCAFQNNFFIKDEPKIKIY